MSDDKIEWKPMRVRRIMAEAGDDGHVATHGTEPEIYVDEQMRDKEAEWDGQWEASRVIRDNVLTDLAAARAEVEALRTELSAAKNHRDVMTGQLNAARRHTAEARADSEYRRTIEADLRTELSTTRQELADAIGWKDAATRNWVNCQDELERLEAAARVWRESLNLVEQINASDEEIALADALGMPINVTFPAPEGGGT